MTIVCLMLKGVKGLAEIKVNPDLCKGCGLCIEVCPKKILRFSEGYNKQGNHYAEQFNAEQCIGCKFCGIQCPDLAIEVYR